MWRVFLILVALTAAALAQVPADMNLAEQLLPESFRLEAQAISARTDAFDFKTVVTYTLTNNSGMNLYIGILSASVSIGRCGDIRTAHGALQLLRRREAIAYGIDLVNGPARPVFVPAGARIAGTLEADDCAAPNPGSPTAPLAMTLVIGKRPEAAATIRFPISAVIPIRAQ